MSPEEIREIVAGCDRFLVGHGLRSVRQTMQMIADSPLSLTAQDGYGNGGVVAELEKHVAELLGKEAAVFMPSGTMAQQIALRIWSDQAGEPRVAFHPTSHLHLHEQMGYVELHRLQGVLLGDADRLFTLQDLQSVEEPLSGLLIELPQREIGGQLPSWEDLVAICDVARSRGIRLHMDGARLWECGPYYGRSYSEIASLFDSVYVSFYKILFGLPGAILAGPEDFIAQARIWQRRHGGNLQQQSANAITALLGLERHLPKMDQYAAKAQEIAEILRGFSEVRLMPAHPPTNMMHVQFSGDVDRLIEASLQIAQERKVLLFSRMSPTGKWELYTGDGALEIPREELSDLFKDLFRLAA